MCTGALGPDESATILSTGYLANAYSHVERLDEAQRLGEEALKHWKAKLGPDDGRTLTAMVNLGHYYSQAGRINEAIPLLEETLNLKNAKFGPDNEQTATTMGNLANAYSEAGRHDDALRLAEDALKISKSKLGLENIETIMQMSKLAKSYFLAGRIEEAISLDEAALKVAKAKLRPDDDSLLVYMNNLAEDYLQAGRFADADVVVRELIRLEPDNAEWRLDHAIALIEQAVVGSKTSLWDEAAAEFVKAIDLSEDVQISGSMRRKVCCILASSDEVFERVLKLRPEERTLWIGRAERPRTTLPLDRGRGRLRKSHPRLADRQRRDGRVRVPSASLGRRKRLSAVLSGIDGTPRRTAKCHRGIPDGPGLRCRSI